MDLISPRLNIRQACSRDIPAIEALARNATRELLGPFLNEPQQSASAEFTPLDTYLIEDGTYFVLEIEGWIRASGGWSSRDGLLYGKAIGPYSGSTNSDSIARLRAMYTDPIVARKGLARAMVALVEASARLASYKHMELLATPVGLQLYENCGYKPVSEVEVTAANGTPFRLMRMAKELGVAGSG